MDSANGDDYTRPGQFGSRPPYATQLAYFSNNQLTEGESNFRYKKVTVPGSILGAYRQPGPIRSWQNRL